MRSSVGCVKENWVFVELEARRLEKNKFSCQIKHRKIRELIVCFFSMLLQKILMLTIIGWRLSPTKVMARTQCSCICGQVDPQLNRISFCCVDASNPASTWPRRRHTRHLIPEDHDLIVAWTWGSRAAQMSRICFDFEKLQDPNLAEILKAKVGGNISSLRMMDCDVNILAENIKEVVLSSEQKGLGCQRKNKKTLGHERHLRWLEKGKLTPSSFQIQKSVWRHQERD